MAVAQTSRHTLPYSRGQTTAATAFDQVEPTAVAASNMQEDEDGDSMGLNSSDYMSQDSSGAVGDNSNSMAWSTAAAAPRRMTEPEDVGASSAARAQSSAAAGTAAGGGSGGSGPSHQQPTSRLQQQQQKEQQEAVDHDPEAATTTATAAAAAVAAASQAPEASTLPVLSALQLVGCGAQRGAVAALLAAGYGRLEELVLGDVLLLPPQHNSTVQLPAQQPELGGVPGSPPAPPPAAAAAAAAAAASAGRKEAAGVQEYLQATHLLQLPVHWPALVQLQAPGHVLWDLAAAAQAAACAQQNSSSSNNRSPPDLWRPLLQASTRHQQQRQQGSVTSDTRPTMFHLQRVTVNSSRHRVFVSPGPEAAQQLQEVVTRSLQQVLHLRQLVLADAGLVVASNPAAWAAASSFSNNGRLPHVQQQQPCRWGRVVPLAALEAPGWEGQQQGWEPVADQLLATLPRCRISVTAESTSE
jgi:hypothetical protein